MGDRYSNLHKRKNPKRTAKQIEEDRIKRKEQKAEIK